MRNVLSADFLHGFSSRELSMTKDILVDPNSHVPANQNELCNDSLFLFRILRESIVQ